MNKRILVGYENSQNRLNCGIGRFTNGLCNVVVQTITKSLHIFYSVRSKTCLKRWSVYDILALEYKQCKLFVNFKSPLSRAVFYDPLSPIFTTPRTYSVTCIYVVRDYTPTHRILKSQRNFFPLSTIWFGSRFGFVLEGGGTLNIPGGHGIKRSFIMHVSPGPQLLMPLLVRDVIHYSCQASVVRQSHL